MMIVPQLKVRKAALPGRYPVGLERAARGRGLMPPLQAHPEDTTYAVLTGEITFYVGADVVPARPGTVVLVRAGVAHTFRVESDCARWRVSTAVASVTRFDDLGRALAQPGAMTEDDEAAVTAIAGANAIRILGSPGALPAAAAA